MDITHMTYALVKEKAAIPHPQLRRIQEVAGFLTDHVRKLLESSSATDAAPPGRFFIQDQQTFFRHMHAGDTQEFLDAYHGLAAGLVAKMNKSTASGLLVGLRVNTETDGVVAGVLKLEVVAPNAAALQEDEHGEVRLEAVQDMLERPGKLQKSALVTSRLPDERVWCGDQLHTQSKYFPEALGIKVHPRPRAAMKSFFDTVWAVEPKLGGPVAAAVGTCKPGTVPQVLAELGAKIPELTSRLQAEIVQQLAALPQPVSELDPGRPIKATYKIGELTVTGPISEIGQLVRVSQQPDGRWQLTIDSDQEPTLVRH